MDKLVLDLKDPRIIETYFFGPNRVVGATIGEKNGALSAPVFSWKARKELLIIDDENGKPYDRLRLIEVRPSTVVVERRDGTEAVYAIKRK